MQVTAIIFVLSLSSYDEALWEEKNLNVMVESLSVLHKTWTNEIFENTPFIIFLNKNDMFKEKLAHGHSIKEAFPTYNGSTDYKESIASLSLSTHTQTHTHTYNRVFYPCEILMSVGLNFVTRRVLDILASGNHEDHRHYIHVRWRCRGRTHTPRVMCV